MLAAPAADVPVLQSSHKIPYDPVFFPGGQGTLHKNRSVYRQSYRIAAAAIALFALALAPARLDADPSPEPNAKLFLRSDWTLQSSCQINATPAQISSPGFSVAG